MTFRASRIASLGKEGSYSRGWSLRFQIITDAHEYLCLAKCFSIFFLYFLGTKPFNTVRVLALVIRTGPDLPVRPVKKGTRASTGPGHLKDRTCK